MKPTLVVLAAGMGSRYGGLKQLDEIGPNGEAIIDYSVFDAIRAGFGKVVFVIRKSIENDFIEHIGSKFEGKITVDYAFQELDNIPKGLPVPEGRTKPWGTAHAVMVAENYVNEPFAVINADDFYGKEAYQTMANFLTKLSNDDPTYCILGYHVENTLSKHGTVSRAECIVNDQHNLVQIQERTKILEEEGKIIYYDDNNTVELARKTPVSMNFMGFTPSAFKFYKQEFDTFIHKNIENPTAEFYLPFVLDVLIKTKKATIKVIETPEIWFGVTYKEDKQEAIDNLEALIQKGVYPSKLW